MFAAELRPGEGWDAVGYAAAARRRANIVVYGVVDRVR